jgi:predicted HTH domain antitoxin
VKQIVLNIPDTVALDEKEAKNMLAANLYECGKLSLGQAAELAGYSKRGFMELLGSFNVSLFNDDEGELDNDIANAKRYHI